MIVFSMKFQKVFAWHSLVFQPYTDWHCICYGNYWPQADKQLTGSPDGDLWYQTDHINRTEALLWSCNQIYRKVSNIRRAKCQNLNESRLVLQFSVPNPPKPSVKSIMKM